MIEAGQGREQSQTVGAEVEVVWERCSSSVILENLT